MILYPIQSKMCWIYLSQISGEPVSECIFGGSTSDRLLGKNVISTFALSLNFPEGIENWTLESSLNPCASDFWSSC